MTHPTIALIEQRFSANLFDASHRLSDGEIERLVHLAVRAPTACHLQNWRFVAVRSPEGKTHDEVPVMLVAVGRAAPGNWPQKPRRPLAEVLDMA